jgi:type VI secretion system (T6SS) effector Tae4 (amidase)
MLHLPPYAALAAHYPAQHDAEDVKRAIGANVDDDWITNTCVIRMSRAFNYCGIAECAIPPDGSLSTVRGEDDKRYAFRVNEFIDYLKATYGPPDIFRTEQYISEEPFLGKTGIMAWEVNWADATGHFTLWDGHRGLYEGNPSYFTLPKTNPGNGSAWLHRVELWRC